MLFLRHKQNSNEDTDANTLEGMFDSRPLSKEDSKEHLNASSALQVSYCLNVDRNISK